MFFQLAGVEVREETGWLMFVRERMLAIGVKLSPGSITASVLACKWVPVKWFLFFVFLFSCREAFSSVRTQVPLAFGYRRIRLFLSILHL